MTIKKIFLLFFIFSLSLAGQTKDKYQPVTDSFLAMGQTKELVKYFEKELKAHPNNENILRWLGYSNIADNNFDEGEKYYRAALKINPACGRCYANLGRVYIGKNDLTSAMDYFNKAINTDPKDARFYEARANLKEVIKDKIGAAIDYDKAIELAPDDPDLLLSRGTFNLNDGTPSLALADFSKAIRLAPKYYLPYLRKAEVYYGKRMYKEALTQMKMAWELDSTKQDIIFSMAAIYSATAEYEKALAFYNRYLLRSPQDYSAYYERGLVNYKLEDMEGTCTDMQKAKLLLEKKDPGNTLMKEINAYCSDLCDSSKSSYYYQRGIAFFNLGQGEKSLYFHSEGIKKFPDDPLLFSFRANTNYNLRNYQNAINDYSSSNAKEELMEKKLKESPRYNSVSTDSLNTQVKLFVATNYFSMAECNFGLGKYDEALLAVNKGLELLPEQKVVSRENFINLRGCIFLVLEKNELALKDFDYCILKKPDFAAAYINRAVAKINSPEKQKIKAGAFFGGMNSDFYSNWNFPVKGRKKYSETIVISALEDCNLAIALNSNFGYAFLVRGKIKKILEDPDYCKDLMKARKLGIDVEEDLFYGCGN